MTRIFEEQKFYKQVFLFQTVWKKHTLYHCIFHRRGTWEKRCVCNLKIEKKSAFPTNHKWNFRCYLLFNTIERHDLSLWWWPRKNTGNFMHNKYGCFFFCGFENFNTCGFHNSKLKTACQNFIVIFFFESLTVEKSFLKV